jgi:hypothetical protein
MRDLQWSKREKQIAQRAFRQALAREANEIVQRVHSQAAAITELDDAWRLEEYLREVRKEFDQKYDYRYSVLLYVFANLIEEGWLSLDELAGLGDDKLTPLMQMLAIRQRLTREHEMEGEAGQR